MSAYDEVDRRLALFLDEGPIRSPDRPVEAAIAHAVAHPRRRDPLVALRRDPMAPRSRWTTQPVLVFAALGLLLVMSAAAVFVGSRGQPAVQPITSPPPSPPVSASPSAPRTPATFSAQITDANGLTKTIIVTDESGRLERVVGGEVTDPDRPQNAEIEAVQLGADEGGGMSGLVLHWVDLSCPGDYELSIDETARELVLQAATCHGDSLPVAHEVWLQFSEPVPAGEVDERIVRR